jgi:hypothetical protein
MVGYRYTYVHVNDNTNENTMASGVASTDYYLGLFRGIVPVDFYIGYEHFDDMNRIFFIEELW